MKKLLSLIPAILCVACSIEVDLTFDKETSGPASESNSSTSEIITTSGDFTNGDHITTSLETLSSSGDSTGISDTSGNSESCMILDNGRAECPPELVCIALSFTQEGQCVIPCNGLDECPDDLICQDWTALSQPQLPSGMGNLVRYSRSILPIVMLQKFVLARVLSEHVKLLVLKIIVVKEFVRNGIKSQNHHYLKILVFVCEIKK